MRRYTWALCLAALGTAALSTACTNEPTACASSRECSSAGLVCDLAAGRCVECVLDLDCLEADEICRGNVCEVLVPCATSRMCPGQVCDLVRGYCVDCVNETDCDPALECSADGFCVEPPPESCRAPGACVPREQSRTSDGCPPGQDRGLRCSATCVFEDEGMCMPIAGCPGVPECTPGTRARIADGCGVGETREVECQDDCTNLTISDCIATTCLDASACTPGEMVQTTDGCGPGETRELTCDDACVLVETSACTPNACELPGAIETVACGDRCGMQDRTCSAERIWEYAACLGEGVCVPGTMDSVACGNCGTQSTQCSALCEWEPAGMCVGEGACSPGSSQLIGTGCPPAEARLATCDASCALMAVGSCEPVTPGGATAFVLPYLGTPMPASHAVAFRTSIQAADIYFLFDITGSMSTEIDTIRAAVVSLISSLECVDRGTVCSRDGDCIGTDVCNAPTGTCIESPSLDGCVPDPWTGTGYYEAVYENQLSLQPDASVTATEIATFMTFGGTENLYQSVGAVADPVPVPGTLGCTGPTLGFVGCPSFRETARRIMFVFTDEDSDFGSEFTAGAALVASDITLIGINSEVGSTAARLALEALAVQANAFRADGITPLVYDGADAAASAAVQMGLDEVLTAVPQRITVGVEDLPGDAGDALQFVDVLQTNTTGVGCAVFATEDTDGDFIDDTFTAVPPGGNVCFDVVALANTTVMPTIAPQVFQARVTIYGDGSPLDQEDIYFVVPGS